MNIKRFPLLLAGFIATLVLVAFIAVGYLLSWDENPRLWQAILINYLFFTPLAAGMVVCPAIVVVCHGRWMGSLEKICWTGISFSIPSTILLVLLWVGSSHWAVWLGSPKFWLNSTFLFSRNMLLLVAFWATAFLYLKQRYKQNSYMLAVWLILMYVITFTIEGFDLVMTIDPKWHSLMMGGYFFISGLYGASVAWIFLSTLLEKYMEKKILHDIGNLALTFCMLTGYLMISQLLPIWYENMPEETSFLVPRLNFSWKYISYVLIALVYAGPVLLLLNRWLKEKIFYMRLIAFLILIGLWIERWWLVSAALKPENIRFGWAELIPTLVFAIAMAVGVLLSLKSLSSYSVSTASGYE